MLTKIRNLVVREKGQDLIEYALLLAIIVGIGWIIVGQSSIKDDISTIFTNAKSMTTQAASVSNNGSSTPAN